jgi:hypothetical protein
MAVRPGVGQWLHRFPAWSWWCCSSRLRIPRSITSHPPPTSADGPGRGRAGGLPVKGLVKEVVTATSRAARERQPRSDELEADCRCGTHMQVSLSSSGAAAVHYVLLLAKNCLLARVDRAVDRLLVVSGGMRNRDKHPGAATKHMAERPLIRGPITLRALTWKSSKSPAHAHPRWSPAVLRSFNTHNKCTGVCRFVRGISVGVGRVSLSCGVSVGLAEAHDWAG